MFGESKILALIPARAGSKGIVNKNIIDLCGKPLIAYTIEAAIKSQYIDSVVVSTDGEEIAEIAKLYGADVPFLRPERLAQDTSKTIDAVLHAVETLRENGKTFDTLVLLQPTQPLRTTEDIDGSIEVFYQNMCKPLVGVSDVNDHPILMRSISEEGLLKPLLELNSTCRRQDMPAFYRVNGTIYINAIGELSESTSFNDNLLPYIMDKSHSIDIDDKMDLEMAKIMIKQGCEASD